MKVKVRRGPGLTGSQKNYGLVTGSIWNYEDKPTSNNVGTTLSPVPRDEATIEAERGETVIGDLDNDGMVEHAKIGGKRHSHGGTPLNVPDGSFVFSDYRGLLIKNPDILKNIFGMNSSKAVTPAKVAQRYEINKFKNMLNDPFIDPIDRKTAQLMIDNNMRKLGQLALIQEGMKGFPDGIPAIAQPLMGSDFAQQGGQQKMRRGGIVSYKKGGPAKYQGTDKSQVDLSGYNDMRSWIPLNAPTSDQNQMTWDASWNELPDWLEDIDQDGMITPADMTAYQQNKYKVTLDKDGNPYFGLNRQMTPDTTGKAYAEEHPLEVMLSGFVPFQTQRQRDAARYLSGEDNQALSLPFSLGIGAAAGYVGQRYGPRILDATGRLIKKIPGVQTIGDALGYGWRTAGHFLKDNTFPNYFSNREFAKLAGIEMSRLEALTGKKGYPGAWQAVKNIGKYTTGPLIGMGTGFGIYAFDKNEEANKIPDDALDNKGTDATQQIQGDVDMINYTPPTPNGSVPATTTVKKVPGTQKVIVRTGTKPAKAVPATNRVATPDGNAVILNTDSILQYKSKELGGSLGEYQGQNRSQVFTQYTPTSQISSTQDYDVIAPNIDVPYGFTVQHYDPKLGIYTITDPKTGQTIPLDMDNFVNVRHGALLDTYPGGRAAWRENALSHDQATREAANDWFQGTYEDWRKQRNLPSYFYGKPGKDPYGRDKKLGIYTWSAPGIAPKVKPAETPQPQPQPQPEETKITPPNWQKTRAGYPRARYADILGEEAAAAQRFERYPSMYSPVENAPYETIYRKYNTQPVMGVYAANLQNAGTGPDSARNIDNVTGKVLEAIAQGQEQTEEQVNNPRFLDMLARQQQAKLQTSAAVSGEKLRYLDDAAIKWDAFLDNYNKKMANIGSKAATTKENQDKLALIKAMYPYANLEFDETPTANATLRSITDTPITGAGATGSDSFSTTYQSIVDGFIKQGLSKEKAVEQANAYMRNYIAMTKAGTAGAMTDPFGLIGS